MGPVCQSLWAVGGHHGCCTSLLYRNCAALSGPPSLVLESSYGTSHARGRASYVQYCMVLTRCPRATTQLCPAFLAALDLE